MTTMPYPEHECVDHHARQTIEHVRDEHASDIGKIMREVGDTHAMIRHLLKHSGAPPFVRQTLNGTGRARTASGSAIEEWVEEVTGSHHSPSGHPVQAWLQRKTGQAVWWMVAGVLAIGTTLAVEHGIMAVVHWLK